MDLYNPSSIMPFQTITADLTKVSSVPGLFGSAAIDGPESNNKHSTPTAIRNVFSINGIVLLKCRFGNIGLWIWDFFWLDAFPLQPPYYRLCNVCQVVADFFNIVHKVDKNQAGFRRTDTA